MAVALLAEGVGRNDYCVNDVIGLYEASPSSRRAWVEIFPNPRARAVMVVALLAEGVGRNRLWMRVPLSASASPSSRRAWVEIAQKVCRPFGQFVALLAEGVGRNNGGVLAFPLPNVALLAEGVGRNRPNPRGLHPKCVALLAEGVGRNFFRCVRVQIPRVALLAEGVGRNRQNCACRTSRDASPSSRRAWVEIQWARSFQAASASRPPRGGRG